MTFASKAAVVVAAIAIAASLYECRVIRGQERQIAVLVKQTEDDQRQARRSRQLDTRTAND
jgi:hypothetical protein